MHYGTGQTAQSFYLIDNTSALRLDPLDFSASEYLCGHGRAPARAGLEKH